MRNNKGQFIKGTHWRKKKLWWNDDWLYDQYIIQKKPAAQIGLEGNVTEAAILYWLKKHGITCRTMSEIRKKKHWGACGSDNPMWNRKGELNPNWKGGASPERQAFYSSREWKKACSTVWKRDNATCQRCLLKHSGDIPFHIHHIVSFTNKKLRANIMNLILVCEICHHFIHSRKNINNEYLSKM